MAFFNSCQKVIIWTEFRQFWLIRLTYKSYSNVLYKGVVIMGKGHNSYKNLI